MRPKQPESFLFHNTKLRAAFGSPFLLPDRDRVGLERRQADRVGSGRVGLEPSRPAPGGRPW